MTLVWARDRTVETLLTPRERAFQAESVTAASSIRDLMDQIESVRKMFVLLFSASMLVAILLIGIIGLRDRQEEGSARD
jgi:hypothetical protein